MGHGGTQRMVDVVLSDMMMNTSGINFKDHAGSMDLCAAALQFARDTLRVGGHFICKFYQGAEDKELERQLRAMFRTVHRENLNLRAVNQKKHSLLRSGGMATSM